MTEQEILRRNAEAWAAEAEAMADEMQAEALKCLKTNPLRAWELCHQAGLLRVAARKKRKGVL